MACGVRCAGCCMPSVHQKKKGLAHDLLHSLELVVCVLTNLIHKQKFFVVLPSPFALFFLLLLGAAGFSSSFFSSISIKHVERRERSESSLASPAFLAIPRAYLLGDKTLAIVLQISHSFLFAPYLFPILYIAKKKSGTRVIWRC